MIAKVLIICVAFVAAHGSILAPAGYGAVLSAGSLGIGKGLIAAPAVATVSSQKAVINHVAPSASVASGPAPVALASHGILTNRLVGRHGISAASLAVGAGIYGAPIALGVGHLGLGHGVAALSQKSIIGHVAPAAPVAVAAAPIALASHGIYGNGIGLGHGVGLAHGVAAASQKSIINHVAPAAPVALANHGIYGNGIAASNGLLANGIVSGHGVGASPLAIGLSAPVALGHGATVSSQKSVISHVAPAARVAVAVAPITLANTGILSNGLIGGHGIVGNGLIAGSPLGIAGHGISALPLSIGSGIHGAPVALGLGKTLFYGSSHH